MGPVTRSGAAAGLMLAVLLLGFAVQGPGGTGGGGTYGTVPALLDAYPTGERVGLTANVSRVADDYVSEAGNTYQQVYVTTGGRELLVFCSTGDGRVDASPGDTVTVRGTFKEFHGTPEIYTDCARIDVGK